MIAKNEEKYLRQCLNSARDFVDEIIVVDTGSTDETKQIAKKFNAVVFDFGWTDSFSDARNESMKHATKDWILVLDADEIIEKPDFEKIKNLIAKEKEFDGFAFEQRSYSRKYSEGSYRNNSSFDLVAGFAFYVPNFLVRLFKSDMGFYFKNRVHELIEDSIAEKKGKYRKTDVVVHHFGSVKEQNLVDGKKDQYSRLILKQLEDDPGNSRYNYQAARMHLGQGKFSAALEYFERTARLNPNYKLVFSEIAKVYLRLNDKGKAIENFKKSMIHNPNNPNPANNLAVVYMSMGKFQEARGILEEQLKKHPDNKPLKYNYKKVLENLK